MKDMKADLLKVARLIAQEREVSERARRLRDKIGVFCGKGYYSSVGICEGGALELTVKLTVYIRLFPDSQPKLVKLQFQTEEPWFEAHYPLRLIGEYAPGKTISIEAWSGRIESTPPVAAATTTEATA
jgi:hypothetical protein